MQANVSPPWPLFVPEKPGKDGSPAYRLVLVFTPPADLDAGSVCRGDARAGAPRSGQLVVFAVYCRNDRPMSQALARTAARGLDDQAVGLLLRQLFPVVFSAAPIIEPVHGYPGGLM